MTTTTTTKATTADECDKQEVLSANIIPDARFINFDSLSKTCVNRLPSASITEHQDDNDDFVIVQPHCKNDDDSSNKSISNEHEDIDRDYDEDELDDADLDDDDDNDDYDEPYDRPYYTDKISILSNRSRLEQKSDHNRLDYLMLDIIKKDDDRDSLVGTSASDEELDISSCHKNNSVANNKFQSSSKEMTACRKSSRFSPFDKDKINASIPINHEVYYSNKKSAANFTEQCHNVSPEPLQLPPTSHSPDTIESSDCDQPYHFTMDAATTYSTNSSQDNLTSLSPLPPLQDMVKLSLSSICNHSLSLPESSIPMTKMNVQITNSNFENCKHESNEDTISSSEHQQQRQSPLYPQSSTLTSIRNAVSHLTRLDDFNVVKLSQGFFSQVFKVTHLPTGKIMVLKMNKNPGNRGNALKEIELLNKLNHPNIVAYMGTVVHEGGLHPLLEYINGGTLEQLIQKYYSSSKSNIVEDTHSDKVLRENVISTKVHRLLNLDKTFIKLMQDVCRGMAYLHSQKYLHRDLASKNIFIRKHFPNDSGEKQCKTEFDDERLEAVIGDFGFATAEPTFEQKLPIVGSPYWLAPECLKNKYNHKCDIFSYGVICCELNWRTPADPDFLPRMDNYAIDFSKLESGRMDTFLSKIAFMACQYEPEKRPEFQELLSIFNHDVLELAAEQKHQLQNSKRPENDIGSQSSRIHFKRFNSFDSSLVQSRQNSARSIFDSSESPTDIFEQHLQRRRYSTLNRYNSAHS
uniref:LIM domain kinase 1-like isoform X2 n=1 Tax=Dermatophagoides pteronyssinus TaxID=6956 RepID=A0A6P6YMG8_DERPT|nr:LIM domain kinase 1-like isoform X2 [Dermatophagoides pteronyssinus]